MGDGLTELNHSTGISEQREKIQELEKEFLDESSDGKSARMVNELITNLKDYLTTKKGNDSWGQKRLLTYSRYAVGVFELKELKKSLQAFNFKFQRKIYKYKLSLINIKNSYIEFYTYNGKRKTKYECCIRRAC